MLSRGNEYIAVTTPFLVLATVCLSLRLYLRVYVQRQASWEDAFVTFSWINATALYSVCVYLVVHDGLGQHFFTLLGSIDISQFLLSFWIGITFYNFAMASAKASIFLQYIRLFLGNTKKAAWAGLVLVATVCLAGLLSMCLFCTPIDKFWHLSKPGTCLSKGAVFYSNAGANIAASVLAIIVPIPSIIKLWLPWRTKLALLAVFSFGIVDIVIAIQRLRYLRYLVNSLDVTYELRDTAIWSVLETMLAIVCASLPVLRPLFSSMGSKTSTLVSRTRESRLSHGGTNLQRPRSSTIAARNTSSQSEDNEAMLSPSSKSSGQRYSVTDKSLQAYQLEEV